MISHTTETVFHLLNVNTVTQENLVTAEEKNFGPQAPVSTPENIIQHEQNNIEQSIIANLQASYDITSKQIEELKKLQPTATLISIIEQLENARTKLSLAMISKAYIEIIKNDISLSGRKIIFSLITWINDIFFMFSEECNGKIMLEKKGLLLGTDEYIVFGNQAALLYAFVNLLKNAIKFTDCATGNKKITVSLKRNKNHFIVTVQDSGIGMTSEQVEHCFDPKLKKYNFTIEGKGSGLANVKQKLQKASGDVTVESTLNKGSAFTITMPLEVKEIISYAIDYSLIRVLAAEDVPQSLKLLGKILTDIGIPKENMTLVPSKEKASMSYEEAYHAKKPFNIVLTDLNMPHENDGLELTRHIRQFESHNEISTPAYITILSGVTEMNEELSKARNLYNEFLKKPYDKKTLFPLIAPIARKMNSDARKKELSQFFALPVSEAVSTEIISLIAEYEECNHSLQQRF